MNGYKFYNELYKQKKRLHNDKIKQISVLLDSFIALSFYLSQSFVELTMKHRFQGF